MFKKLQTQIQAKFLELSATGHLFYINIDRNEIWDAYLSGWADDPVEQQGHNCNCCKSFLRQYAGIAAIMPDNTVQTIWDIEPDDVYRAAINSVRTYVKRRPITDIFIAEQAKIGVEKNLDSKNPQVVWNHFYLQLPRQFVLGSDAIATKQAEVRDNKQVWQRSLDELTIDAVDTVLELIAQNSLYRGKEFEGMLLQFKEFKRIYSNVPLELKSNFCWSKIKSIPQSLAKIRNTSIGTLLIDLSNGVELDEAVRKFEAVVAPTNYKRPTALVTPKMVDNAKEVLSNLGYLPALERRFAVTTDISIGDQLYVDKSSTLADVFEDIKKDVAVNPREFSKVEEITIDKFIADVLPKTKRLEVLLENNHLNKMVTLITRDARNDGTVIKDLFKWDSPFSWAYTGGVTDSIKERVKAAGGKVDGELRVSLSWHNYDDLDIHVFEPNGNRIYYGDKISYNSDGRLDVDMNAGGGHTREGVENIVWPFSHRMQEGVYTVEVHNYSKRELDKMGFTVQIECRGEVFDFEEHNNPNTGTFKSIVKFKYTRKDGIAMPPNVISNINTKEKWNLKTNRFHKVKNIMLSPNCWDTDKGNKHFIFALENCASDEPTRPFFNEFLKEELTAHRKFFEILGGKLLLSPTTNQVAGVGFSETQRNHLIVKVEGAFKRTLKINF